jgi:hypothetical protein
MKSKNMTTPSIRNSISQSPFRRGLPRKQQLPRTQAMWIIRGFLLVPLALAWFALSPTARAVLPAPDGGYAGQNTAEGTDALFSLTTGIGNTASGFDALYHNTTGTANAAHGAYALYDISGGTDNTATGADALFSITTGSDNTANGAEALFSNTTGTDNTAHGANALLDNTTGSRNVATGSDALHSNITGGDNTATGVNALYSNTGSYNTAHGYQALESNTTGTNNTANGLDALNANTTGSNNAANGAYALFSNLDGSFNTANGESALYSNTTGANNTANGFDALYYNTTGLANTANGFQALFNNTIGANNTANGLSALQFNTTGSSNIALGFQAGFNLTTGDNNIDIGNAGVAGDLAKIRIGKKGTHKNTFIAGINGVTVAGGVGVIIDASGHLGTVVSSERFKDKITPMDKASEAILALKPVTFRYKHELDPEGIPQFGLVAEQVEKVNPDLVARDEEGKPYTVRYDAVNAMLLNEFLKEHRKVEALEAKMAQQQSTNSDQQKAIQALTASLKEQAAQIQKVTRLRRVEVTKPALQMVLNNQ